MSVTTSASVPPVRMGAAQVGPGRGVYVIAEAGVNHDGSLPKALEMVAAAADAGADAVKFQVFRAAELVTQDAACAAYQQSATGAARQRDLLERLELDDADFARLRDACARRGVAFLATPFGVRDVGRLVELDSAAIKIASTDSTNFPLLRAASATGKPLIASTGAATEAEIEQVVGLLRRGGAGRRLVLLHCVSAYPTPPEHANLAAIGALAVKFALPVGFSDHTTLEQTGGWAVAAGACVLEKHFTLDRSACGPDHALSLEPAGLKAYIAQARLAAAALGRGTLGYDAIEADVRASARRSLVAGRALRAGVVLTEDMIALKRPAGGIEPADLERVVGRVLRRELAPDEPLAWEDLQ